MKTWDKDNVERLQQLASICARAVSRRLTCHVQSGIVMKYFPTQLVSSLNYFCCNTVTFHPWCFPAVLFCLQEKLETKRRHKLSEEAKYFPLKFCTVT